MKSRDQRFADIVAFLNSEFGKDAATLVERRMDGLPPAQAKQIAEALSLGDRKDKSDAETKRRNAVRTLIYLLLTEGKQPLAMAAALRMQHGGQPLPILKKSIQSRLPIMDASPQRNDWHTINFSPDPTPGPAPASFRYFVFGMMNSYTGRGVSYETLLGDPSMLKTFLISTSVIDQAHVSTYYPYGFILRVPPQCVISTSPKDQAFKNYKAVDPNAPMAPVVLTDMTNEIRRAAAAYPIQSPEAILAGTTKARGETGYNEVAVLGTAPTGEQIGVIGMFMKLDSKGNRYVRPIGPKTPWVTDAIYAKMQKTGLPIMTIVDGSGQNG